ncbi:hypothetical protein [Streptomyces pratensis]|uniref:hypothetical protein n=1 Tax=Streptomyces pratensis TaxID=1169025 RepID=UPI00301A7D8A
MPDRRRRTAFRLPLPERAAPLMRERPSSSPDSSAGPPSSPSGSGSAPASGSAAKPEDDNPFAAPPADRPDQPWQPRLPAGSGGDGGEDSGPGDGSSSGGRSGWGSQWSSKQPGRGSGGFGGRPGANGAGGKGGPGGGPAGPRWDPTDPTQRRARYALLGGMWAFFFALFDFPEIALLLGALSVYWAVSALRAPQKSALATDSTADDGTRATAPATGDDVGTEGGVRPGPTPLSAAPRNVSSRQQTTAAVSGLVTALLALLIVVTSYTVQLVYRDYYTCVNDALTKTGALACNEHLPKPLEPLFGVKE